VHPTGGSRRVFKQFAWLEAGSGKVALSRPAHQRVTPAVGWQVKEQKQCAQVLTNFQLLTFEDEFRKKEIPNE